MTKIHLVLGGSGFVGRHVVALLTGRGERVRVADRVPPPVLPGIDAALVEWRPFDLAEADWHSLVEDTDVVHHYAWSSMVQSAEDDPEGDVRTNVLGSLALLQAIRRRGQGRIVFASSGGTVYGVPSSLPIAEDHPLAPVGAYGAGKVAVENYLRIHHALHGVDARIARLSNPYGAGYNARRAQGAVNVFIARAIADEPVTIWGDGNVVRDYIHVSDAAAGLVALADADAAAGVTVNIASGVGSSLNAVIETIGQVLGRPVAVSRAPGRAYDVPANILDISLARERLDWSPRLDLAQGIGRTVADLSAGADLSRS